MEEIHVLRHMVEKIDEFLDVMKEQRLLDYSIESQAMHRIGILESGGRSNVVNVDLIERSINHIILLSSKANELMKIKQMLLPENKKSSLPLFINVEKGTLINNKGEKKEYSPVKIEGL